MQKIIINGVELDPKAALKERLVTTEPEKVQRWISSFSAQQVLCVVANTGNMKDIMEQIGYETQVISDEQGILCQEESAVWKAISGEKAYPCHFPLEQREKNPPVVNMLDLISKEEISHAIYEDDQDLCVVQNLINLVNRFLEHSCGKCVFCREGLGQMQSVLQGIASGDGKEDDLQALYELSGLLETQVLCGFGPLVARELMTRVERGKESLLAHVQKKHCEQAVCQGLVLYKILGNKCSGCDACVEACPEDAILGKKRFIHVIQERDCTNCGECAKVCPEKAIVKCSALNKPLCPPRPIPVGAWKK